MLVACPGCGREYDAELFRGGRTVRCTCGTRVGAEERIGPAPDASGETPRFVADVMLGHLARWLRIMGYDVAWSPEAEDQTLVRRALDEDRILLTRDRRLPEEWRIRNVVVLDEEHPSDQIRAVVRRFGLEWEEGLFTRCSRCNEPLDEMNAAEVRARQSGSDPSGGVAHGARGPEHGARGPVPDEVLRRARRFHRCPSCGRVYWEGSHTARIRARLDRLLEDPGSAEAH